MKIKRIAALVVAASMVFLLAACGKVEDFDAKGYVQACLDAKYKGDYKAYAEALGVTEGEAKTQMETEFNDSLTLEIANTGLVSTPEDIARYQQMERELRTRITYEIKEVVKDDEDNFTVDVEVTPLDAYSQLDLDFETKLIEAVENGAQENEYLGIFLDCQQESIDNAKELEPTIVTLHVTHDEINDQMVYTVDEDDMMSFDQIAVALQ